MHKKEKEWLEGKASEEAKNLRNEYLKTRSEYSKAVKRAKRGHLNIRREKVENHLRCPKKFWRDLKRMNVTKRKKQGHNLLHVFDEEGDVKSGEDALAIWKNHFVKVLAGGLRCPIILRCTLKKARMDLVTIFVNLSPQRKFRGLLRKINEKKMQLLV